MIGVDIGSVFIKAIDVARGKSGLGINAVGVIETPENTVINGVVVDPAPAGMALRSLLSSNGFKGKRAVISVGGQSSLSIRVVDLPKMSDAEIRRSMEIDLERHLPFPVEGVVHDFVRISPPDASPDEPGVEVLLAAAQEPLIEGHVKVLDYAGLFPVAIDIEPLALCRSLVSLDGEGGPRTVAIVNIGSQLTEISVVRDGLLRFVRSTPIAGESFTNAIGQGLVTDAKHAEELKRQYATILLEEGLESEAERRPPPGPPPRAHTPLDLPPEKGEEEGELAFGPPPLEGAEEQTMPGLEDLSRRTAEYLGAEVPAEEKAPPPAAPTRPEPPPVEVPPEAGEGEDYTRRQISRSLLSPLADLAREIHSTLDYFSTRKGLEVERVILTGGSSQILHLAEFMSRELGVETVLGDPIHHLSIGAPTVSADSISSASPLLAVCTGLAIRDLL